jgi:peptide/nickel transport system substrate-binding protein
MKHFSRFTVVCLALILVLSAGLIAAQDTPGPGEGGVVVWGNQRGSANLGPLVPIQCSGVDCADVNALLYPDFIGVDYATESLQPFNGENTVSNALVTGWEVSEDGLTYTFSLRDDLTWNDGTPITAKDVYFSWDAIQHGDDIALSSSYGPTRSDIVGATIVDDYTIQFHFEAPNCLAINRSSTVSPLPAHAYGYEPGADFDFTTMATHPFMTEPTVTSGPFKFSRVEPGTAVYLEADQNYADPMAGGVIPTGFVYLDVPDYNIMAERLLAGQAGDVNYMNQPDAAVLPTLINGGAQVFQAPGTLWHYVALNVADPNNPQNGLDEAGNPIDQGRHPLFGDKRVRQALQHAINIDEIINGPLNGNGVPMIAGTIPTAFTLSPTLERRAFDLDAARALLDEAGWVATGDPLVDGGDGLRTCQGCETAEEGTEFVFEIMNVGDVRNDVAVLLQAQFAPLGIQVDITVLDFNAMYDDNLGAQTYDAAVAGWRGSVPFDADQRDFFGAEQDIYNAGSGEYGFNFPSWYNARFEELGEYVATVPGCSEEDIKTAAYEMQEILYDEQPYLWLYVFNNVYAAGTSVVGFDPFPASGTWNMDAWYVEQ